MSKILLNCLCFYLLLFLLFIYRSSFHSKLYDGGVRGVPHAHLNQIFEISDLSGVRIGIFPEWFYDSAASVSAACMNAGTAHGLRAMWLIALYSIQTILAHSGVS